MQLSKRQLAYLLQQQFNAPTLDQYIKSLGPAAWFRMDQGVTVTGAGISQVDDLSGNARHLLDPGTTRPIYLPYSGTKYLYCPAVASNNATSPDSAAASITGDIDIRIWLAAADYTPSAAVIPLSKMNAAGSYCYQVSITATGAVQLLVSADGTATIANLSSATLSTTDGANVWIRVTRVAATGKANFYTSSDGSSWTLLGVEQSGTSGNIFDGNSQLCIGSQANGTSNPFNGKIYRAIIKNGINGTTVVDFNPADASDGATSFASSATGETWTVNSSGALPAQIVGRASALFNGTSHYLKCNAFTLNQPTCVLMVVNVKAWTANDRLFDGNASDSVTALQNTSTPKISLNAGVALGPITPPLNELHVHKYVANGASSSIGYDKNASTTGNAGTNNMGGFTLCARGAGDVPINAQVYETVIFPIAPSTAQLDRLIAGLMARHGLT